MIIIIYMDKFIQLSVMFINITIEFYKLMK